METVHVAIEVLVGLGKEDGCTKHALYLSVIPVGGQSRSLEHDHYTYNGFSLKQHDWCFPFSQESMEPIIHLLDRKKQWSVQESVEWGEP